MSANASTRKQTVGVIFGSRSVEHDVSIVTAQQVIRALDPARYTVIPIYITRDGRWLTGEPLLKLDTFKAEDVAAVSGVQPTTLSPNIAQHGLITPPIASGLFGKSKLTRLDVIFPTVHGTHGEDGTLQGLFELADIPYVGAGVAASAVANDKILAKSVLAQAGLPIVPGISFSRYEWLTDQERVLKRIEDKLAYPLFVKPATLGSSVGISRPADRQALMAGMEMVLDFDRRVLVESAIQGATEINCAVMGNTTIRPSVLEQPIGWEQFLTFENKYLSGGDGMKSAERIIPAPLDAELTARIRQMAVDTFRAVDGRGTARIDFLLNDGTVYVNEINTLPGSLAFYLWQEEKMSPTAVCDELIRLAFEAFAEKRRTTYDFKSRLLTQVAARGLKGAKGVKS
ncbi:MAG: D-alanine--D-alanine ligase family protein [Aggregatilineales bacterium]